MDEQNKNYWFHRVCYEWQVAYTLLEKGYLSIGWSDMGYDKYLDILKENFDAVQISEWNDYIRNKKYLRTFICEMKQDDIVIVPKYGFYEFYKIVDDTVITRDKLNEYELELKSISGIDVIKDSDNYLSVNGKIIDLGFFRKVEKIKTISKNSCGNAFNNQFDNLVINISMNNYKNEINSIINATNNYENTNKYDVMSDVQANINHYNLEMLTEWFFYRVGQSVIMSDSVFNNVYMTKPIQLIYKYFIINSDISKNNIYAVVNNDNNTYVNEQWVLYNIKRFKNNSNAYKLWVISLFNDYSDAIKRQIDERINLFTYKEFISLLLMVEFRNCED